MIKFLKYTIFILLALAVLEFFTGMNMKPDLAGGVEAGKKIVSSIPILKKTPCQKILHYSIGEFDDRFGISKDEFVAVIREAEYVWESETGENLFQYDFDAQFKVNLHFDERQKQSIDGKVLTENYQEVSASQKKILDEYKKLNELYQAKLSAYNESAKKYEDDVEEYNSDVKKWNERGGLSKKEYDDLQERGEALKDRYDELEKKRIEINNLTERINRLASQEGNLIGDYNNDVKTFRDRYGESQEFNQGEYDGTEINIYEFKDKKDLVLVLAHELGHSLNIGHVDNPKSIMYYLMGEQDMNEIKLTQEDLNALNVQCGGK